MVIPASCSSGSSTDSRRIRVKKLLAISATIAALLVLPFAYAQEREAGPFGGYSIGFGGTRISAKDAARPAPRLPDGKPDLSGPWERGGVNNDFETDAGMKKGELDRILLPW